VLLAVDVREVVEGLLTGVKFGGEEATVRGLDRHGTDSLQEALPIVGGHGPNAHAEAADRHGAGIFEG
jgi:hypothetical protein